MSLQVPLSSLSLEDTFIMMDALEADLPTIKRVNVPIVLEIGSGSGCVSSFIAHALDSGGGRSHSAHSSILLHRYQS